MSIPLAPRQLLLALPSWRLMSIRSLDVFNHIKVAQAVIQWTSASPIICRIAQHSFSPFIRSGEKQNEAKSHDADPGRPAESAGECRALLLSPRRPSPQFVRLVTISAISAHSSLTRKLRRSFCLGTRAEYGSECEAVENAGVNIGAPSCGPCSLAVPGEAIDTES
jgi:hypothetical protein